MRISRAILAMHAIFQLARSHGTLLSLAHGYVVEHGKIFGLKDALGRTKRESVTPRPSTSFSLDNTDVDGTSAEGLNDLSLAIAGQTWSR